jgi:vacuolar-type H+-ATPase subunit E/Vma4
VNLDSLRTAFVAQAEADIARRQAEIEAERERRLAAARDAARSLVEQAKLEGRAAGEGESSRRRRMARRAAHGTRLEARGALYDELRGRARAEVLVLRSEPGYGALLDRLAEAAREQLGADAAIERDPPAAGGIIGRYGRRSVDYTLPALVDRELAGMGKEVERLWR